VGETFDQRIASAVEGDNTVQCPSCTDQTLLMTERKGVEIDYCPSCRGVWLDRGELDKLLDATASSSPKPSGDTRKEQAWYDREWRDDDRDRYGKPYKKKKSSLLGEIFDF
jgi:hypothetical protein